MIRVLALLLVCVCAGCATPSSESAGNASSKQPGALPDGLYAEFTTPRGVILCQLHFEKVPLTVTNFVGLAEGTLGPAPRKRYFDGQIFHRVVPGFVIQGGDPTGTGLGGPGYRFPDEFAAGLRHDGPGILSMANSGPDTNGSQFFITLGEARYLDYVHSIFGRVVRGAEVLPEIRRGDTISVKIIREGRAAQRFQADEKGLAQLLARASRAVPPHFVDRSGIGAPGEHWQAKYLEYRLANLARFTGRHIFVRLLADVESEHGDETAEQFVAALPSKSNLPAGSILACYIATADRWFLAGAAKGLVLPEIKPPSPPAGASLPADGVSRQRQNQLYQAAGQVVSSLIDQTDPK